MERSGNGLNDWLDDLTYSPVFLINRWLSSFSAIKSTNSSPFPAILIMKIKWDKSCKNAIEIEMISLK
jgi:hypothetical protein